MPRAWRESPFEMKHRTMAAGSSWSAAPVTSARQCNEGRGHGIRRGSQQGGLNVVKLPDFTALGKRNPRAALAWLCTAAAVTFVLAGTLGLL